jgi:uroporphyrinogen-III synthase
MIYLLSPLKKDGTISLPMISFEIISKKIDFSNIDTLMFTSKQAVVSTNNIDKSWTKYPSIAIGEATKNRIEELGGKILYYPKKFYGEVLANDIKERFINRKILYLRPEQISFDSKNFLKKEGIELQEQIIYRTICRKYSQEDRPHKGAIIIFTSPSTIKCFFKNFHWDSSYIAVLIGKATRKHLPTGCKYEIADKPLIDLCIKKANEILITK